MKKIGREVLFLKTGKSNPRNGESSMIRLADGRIMFAYTEYVGEDWADHATAHISSIYSSDEGESWTAPTVIIEKPSDAQNIMSPSLLRLADGALGMVYLRKDVHEDNGVTCMPLFVRSTDEGESWSEPVVCGLPEGYYCAINDGVTVSKSGRIYVPTSYTGARRDVLHKMDSKPVPHVSDVRIACSDDNGRSWYQFHKIFKSPYDNPRGLYEPGLFEQEDGSLWMYARTAFGHQYDSLSVDGGKSWSSVEPNFRFTSPDSPMRVKRVGKYVAAVYNPIGYNCLFDKTEKWGSPKRTPIVAAISKDGGKSFCDRTRSAGSGALLEFTKNTYLLEDDFSDSYCYPSILEVKDGFLVSYYHSDGSDVCLNASKIVKVSYEEIEQEKL